VISVAINAYNREREIGETLESIFSQNTVPKQVVVVDDGSTDNTVSEIERFGKRVDYYRIENSGPGHSRHIAVSKCGQTWVATCDSDDLWDPYHLCSVVETINTFPDSEMIFTNSTRFGPNEKEGYDHFMSIPDSWWESTIERQIGTSCLLTTDSYRQFLSYNPAYVSGQAFKKAEYDRIGGAYLPFSRMNSEDSDLTRRFCLAARVACNKSITSKIRKHADNFSESMAANQLGKYRILHRHLVDLELPTEYTDATKKACDLAVKTAFRHAYWENNYELAKQCSDIIGISKLPNYDRLRLLKLVFKHYVYS